MKISKFHNVFASLFLFLWAATLYPGELFHNHEDELHECHVQCDSEEEAQGIHKDCDHAFHIHESSLPCFLCEFTFQKNYLVSDRELILPGFNETNYTEIIYSDFLSDDPKTQSTRGPPADFLS